MRRWYRDDGWERDGCCIAATDPGKPTGWEFQCSRKRGHGPDGLYCKQHAKMLAQGNSVPVGREEEAA